jgi:hypothetical protein
MDAKLSPRLLTVFVGFAISAFAQIDGPKFAADLHVQFGAPLARQTFLIPAGEMVVDYATNGNVCRIKLPSMGPDDRQPGVRSTKAIDDFILKLVPLTLRGKELRRMQGSSGLSSISWVEYEKVLVAEASSEGRRTEVTVKFVAEKCQDQPIE